VKALEKYGQVVRPEAPAVRFAEPLTAERISEEDLDPARLADPDRSPLNTHAWVSFPAGKGMAKALRDRGFKPIPQTTGSADGIESQSLLVFGMRVQDGLQVAAEFNKDSVDAPGGRYFTDDTMARSDGVTIREGKLAGASTVKVGGKSVSWFQAGMDPDDREPATLPGPTGRPSRQVAVKLPDLERLEELRTLIELGGGKVAAVYSPGQPPDGFDAVREHVISDGVNMALVRSRDPEILSASGVTAWVPKGFADGLPAANPAGARFVTEPSIIFDESRPGVATVNGGSVQILSRTNEPLVGTTADPSKMKVQPREGAPLPVRSLDVQGGRITVAANFRPDCLLLPVK